MANKKWVLILLALGIILAVWGWSVLVSRDAGQSARQGAQPAALHYTNSEYGFSLDLPEAWQGYQVSVVSDPESDGAVVMFGLPVERYRSELEAPEDLKQGVMVAGVRIFTKAYIHEERALCQEAQELVDRYQVALSQGVDLALSEDEQATADDCLSLYDPEFSTNPAVKETFLGDNDTFYFFRIRLTEFDNGFKVTPDALSGEAETVYRSFKSL